VLAGTATVMGVGFFARSRPEARNGFASRRPLAGIGRDKLGAVGSAIAEEDDDMALGER
jgi:hypothetical protein